MNSKKEERERKESRKRDGKEGVGEAALRTEIEEKEGGWRHRKMPRNGARWPQRKDKWKPCSPTQLHALLPSLPATPISNLAWRPEPGAKFPHSRTYLRYKASQLSLLTPRGRP